MNFSQNSYFDASNPVRAVAWYQGADALQEGEAVCYVVAYGTATERDNRRNIFVNRPSLTTNKAFAGVAARSYSAQSGGQLIDINCPGSKGVNVALGIDTVIGTGILSFVAGASGSHRGRFYTGKYRGRGSVIPRRTVTAVLESSMTGGWSLATDGVTLTVSSTTGLSAGDTVVLVGGEAEDGGGAIAVGKYTIASITDATDLVLSSSAVDTTPDAALTCTGYAYTGNPVCQADLLDGDETGGVEFISPPNAGDADIDYMVGGVSYVCGGVTLAADVDADLAQGGFPGEQKAFICLGTLTTNDFTVDLETSGLQLDGSTALAEVLAFDAAADAWYGIFGGAKWHSFDIAGGVSEG